MDTKTPKPRELGVCYQDAVGVVLCQSCADKRGMGWKYDSTEVDLSADRCRDCGAPWKDPWRAG